MSPLIEAAKALSIAGKAASRDRLSQIRWLPPQEAFLRAPDKVKMIRCGNQAYGKTTVALAELIYRCRGRHPYLDVPKGPVTCWVVCASWKQSVAIQGKLWDLVPKELVHPDTKWDPRHGFGQHAPIVVFRNGSSIHFRTAKQDALDFAGATIDVVLFDEPPRRRRNFDECKKRVLARAGVVLLSMTPVNAPVEWIREEAEAGRIKDLHFRLEARWLIPNGHKRPITIANVPRDQAWVDQVIADTTPYEVPVTVHGEWEMRAEGRLFPAWRPVPVSDGGHLVKVLPSVTLLLSLGIDHGLGTGRQTGVLVGVVEDPAGGLPDVYVIDETHSDGMTTSEKDAQDLMLMLGDHNLQWKQLDYAYGDKPTGPTGAATTKGNLDLEDHIRRSVGLRDRRELVPRIHSAKRGKGTGQEIMREGIRLLHQLMLSNKLHVHDRCAWLVECLSKWDGTSADKHKDAVDALRYALRPWIGGGRRGRGARIVRTG